MKDLDMEAIAAEYRRGDSLPVIGRRHGVNQSTIWRRLKNAGVPIRSQKDAQVIRYGGHGDVAALAEELGMPPEQVHELLVRHGFLYDA